MDFWRIAARVADDFNVKQRVNMFVINSVCEEVDARDPESIQNDVAVALLESDIHDLIRDLSRSIVQEATRIRTELQAA